MSVIRQVVASPAVQQPPCTAAAAAHRPPVLLGDLIAPQLGIRPDAIAVRQWDQTLTYRELFSAAARLARRLQEHGVGPEVRVVVCGYRSPELLVSLLGVLLAGGAYVPLDPDHPPARRALVVADAGITVAVVDDAGARALAGSGVRLVRVPMDDGDADATMPVTRATADNAAYVLYTSGSTGQPKGVVVPHRGVVAFAANTARHFDLDETCRSIGFASLGFDASIMDIFSPLSVGGSVAFIPEADRIDPSRLQRFLEAHRVTWGWLPPALLPLIDPDRLPDLRHTLTAGEPPGPEQVARWSAPPRRRFHNWYGPTETTVVVVGTELTGTWERPLPIGRALTGCRAYVLDEAMRPCPVGVPGELHIGGPQVTRGYLNRPGLTAQRFVPDPFGDVPGARLYRTGDRVARHPEYGIEFLGRLDRQVKVAGQRVELGEVESVLRGHPDIAHAVVDTVVGAAGTAELVAYLTPETAPDLHQLREHCADRLPVYMTPTRVVRRDVLPLNTAGKVDLAALRRDVNRAGEAPTPVARDRWPEQTPVERAVAAVWSRVFAQPEPFPTDDFFACGGHSVLAMRLVAALGAELGCSVSVEDVFEGRTPRGLAARVQASERSGERPVRTGHPPALAPAQRRLWFVDRIASDTPAYNIAFAERLRGPLDLAALARALSVVVARHEVLRWRIPDAGGMPTVVVDPPRQVALPVEQLSGPDVARLLRERLDVQAGTPFDLARDPLWRARLFRLGGADDAVVEHILAITVHHVVFDGWSQDVLYGDLGRAYAAELTRGEPDFRALPATYADYVGWVRDRERQRAGTDLTWWVEHLAGAATVLDLPRDRARPPVQTFRGAECRSGIDPRTAGAVRDLASACGTTPYTVLLTAFAQLLRRLTGQRDFIVGAPVADRGHPAFEPMIGFCVDTVPLRLRVDDALGFDAHVQAGRDELLSALARADTPLERIVGALGVNRDLSRNPLVQVLFNMYNFAQARLTLPGIEVEQVRAGLPGSLFDLTLYVSDRGDGFALQAVYNADLYLADRIEALLAGYRHLVAEFVVDPDRPVSTVSLRPSATDSADPLPDPAAALPTWDGPGVVERLTEAAKAHPDALAVAGPAERLTYRQVDELRRRTTSAVRAAGVEPGTALGVLATRDVRAPALLLGVLASGANWAVLDADLPPARLVAQATAAGCRALLACPDVPVPGGLAELPRVTPGEGGVGGNDEPLPASERGYLAFTSGSTGEQKVVLAAERPLAHFLDWYPATFSLTRDDRFAMLAGLAHDPLLRDVFTPLVLGGQLRVPDRNLLRDPVRLLGWLAAERITVVHLTPQLSRLLAGVPDVTLPAARLVAVAGDQLTEADVARLRRLAPDARLVNLYGTTETPQAQAWYEPPVQPDADGESRPVPVGRGIDGAQLVVLGPGGRPAGVGELGEVVIRSRYLASGYAVDGRLDEEGTSARFGSTPDADPGEEDDRMYRTGDLGRYQPDGHVVLAGRTDDQVKIRGYRVELGEVEAALTAHPRVRAAVVVAREDNGERALHAYAVPDRPDFTVDALREHLARLLPGYAVPASVALLPALPLTANGKVDRSALPDPLIRPRTGVADEPSTRTERLIAGVWREVLGLPRVGVADNFFEVGGHSMAVVAVQARLSAQLGREVAIVDLFAHPSIRALAAHFDGAGRSAAQDRAAARIAARRGRSRRPTTNRRNGRDEEANT